MIKYHVTARCETTKTNHTKDNNMILLLSKSKEIEKDSFEEMVWLGVYGENCSECNEQFTRGDVGTIVVSGTPSTTGSNTSAHDTCWNKRGK